MRSGRECLPIEELGACEVHHGCSKVLAPEHLQQHCRMVNSRPIVCFMMVNSRLIVFFSSSTPTHTLP
jgi:hypothetical protein